MSKLTLWKSDFSPPACAVRALGDVLGIQFEYHNVDLSKYEHKNADFMKLNPLSTIPLLKDGDFILSDSHAIMKYLLEKFGTPEQREALYPSDVKTRALVDQAMFCDTGVLFIRQRLLLAINFLQLPTIFEGLKGPTPQHREAIEAAYAIVEAYLTKHKFVAADHLTLADFSVGVSTASLRTIHKLDKTKFPRTSAWLDGMYQIPEFKKYACPGFEGLQKYLETSWEKHSKQ